MAGRKGGEAVSRDRAHMAAIGREGGHSRGARARAAAAGAAAVGVAAGVAGAAYAASRHHSQQDNTDLEQGTGPQPFVRQANEERSGFEAPNRNAGFGSQERRPNNDRDRNDNANEGNSFSSRDRI